MANVGRGVDRWMGEHIISCSEWFCISKTNVYVKSNVKQKGRCMTDLNSQRSYQTGFGSAQLPKLRSSPLLYLTPQSAKLPCSKGIGCARLGITNTSILGVHAPPDKYRLSRSATRESPTSRPQIGGLDLSLWAYSTAVFLGYYSRVATVGIPLAFVEQTDGFSQTMNSLNILSARVIGPTPPQTPTTNRSRSYSDSTLKKANAENKPKRSASQHVQGGFTDTIEEKEVGPSRANAQDRSVETTPAEMSEKTPLLAGTIEPEFPLKRAPRYNKLCSAARRLVNALTESLKWMLSTLTSPGFYIITGFYDERGRFSPLLPLRRLSRALPKRSGRKSTAQAVGLSGSLNSPDLAVSTSSDHKMPRRKTQVKEVRHKPKDTHSFSPATSESEADAQEELAILDMPADRRPRLQTSSSSEDVPQARRSVRIKLYNEDTTRRRKQRMERGDAVNGLVITGRRQQPTLTVANIKSPTSPASSLKLTKYPRAPAPPRPLIPRRQPSYSTRASSHSPISLTQKTLVIDLDETLIHSLAKGGRMSSGHMVEVKLNTTVGYGGATLGPQHPILYYVHKRPHCDDFLRKVCKWYKLVVFTASVQEYADPVIDWLEQERKYFSARYYRQHCTFRNGAYIKDLSSVEPDLSKVMILDNSPLSYIFHEGKNVTQPPKHCILPEDNRQCDPHRGLD